MSPRVQQWAGSGADFPTHSSVQQSCVSEVPDLLLGMHPENLKLLLVWCPVRAMSLTWSNPFHNEPVSSLSSFGLVIPLLILFFSFLFLLCFALLCVAFLFHNSKQKAVLESSMRIIVEIYSVYHCYSVRKFTRTCIIIIIIIIIRSFTVQELEKEEVTR